MEIIYLFPSVLGVMLMMIAIVISNKTSVFLLVFIGTLLILNTRLRNDGAPSCSLSILTDGEKYEVVCVYEKYIIIKSANDTDNEKLRFIGPLDFGMRAVVGSKYVKTSESLEKIE